MWPDKRIVDWKSENGALQPTLRILVARAQMLVVPLLLFVLCNKIIGVSAMCPNACSLHGQCLPTNRCDCWEGWGGADCSERTCPFVTAWFDAATDEDVAHAEEECSARGICNRNDGRCDCMPGFIGAACERVECPGEGYCNGHGRCMSLESFAEYSRGPNSEKYSYSSVWDAKAVHGCVCDPGYTSFDCSEKVCPVGDDPLTTGQVNEIQLVVCQATAGHFNLGFNGYTSLPISFNANEDSVKAALEAMPSIPEVSVTFSRPGSSVCEISVKQVIQVEFLQTFGPLPPMWVTDLYLTPGGTNPGVEVFADGSTVVDYDANPYNSIKGTKESSPCSDRGLCSSTTGTCSCYTSNNDMYASSNGYGESGSRGDCGIAITTVSGCPGEISCSGHGSCDLSTFRCTCDSGWMSGDCSQRTCPHDWSWFSYPSDDDVSHNAWEECSGAGACDRSTGICTCGSVYTGSACERMTCPGGDEDTKSTCSGHGECVTMAERAYFSTVDGGVPLDITYGKDPSYAPTWDAHKIKGCMCDEGYGGYDCSKRECPTGDDPNTPGLPEVQLLHCAGSSGSLTLTFRGETTIPISWDALNSDIEEALEDLETIGNVDVTYHGSCVLCDSGGGNVAEITFITEHGNVPPLLVNTDSLVGGAADLYTDGASINGVDSRIGTTEELVCSNHGLCDPFYGECACFKGWSSSDGAGDHGDRGDCGHRVKGTNTLPSSGGVHDNPQKTTRSKDLDPFMRTFAKRSYRDIGHVGLTNVLEEY